MFVRAGHFVAMMQSTTSITDAAQTLRDDFAFLDDWEARYAHIIDLGKALPPLDESEMNEVTRVHGCASQVWLVSEPSDTPGALRFRGASDAILVSGLIALLLGIFSDRSPDEIINFDAKSFFADLGVHEALSPQRSNGFQAMITRIRAEAETALEKG